jgi:hypothetical protein
MKKPKTRWSNADAMLRDDPKKEPERVNNEKMLSGSQNSLEAMKG